MDSKDEKRYWLHSPEESLKRIMNILNSKGVDYDKIIEDNIKKYKIKLKQ